MLRGENMSKKINIDLIRFLFSFLILAIHISPFEDISPLFDFFFTRVLGRLAVPFFLMITAYFLLDKSLENVSVLKRYTKRIIKIYLFCILLYFPISIYKGDFKEIHLLSILKDIFVDGTMYHLWYFPALIFGLWMVYFLLKLFGSNKAFFISILLYIIGLFGDSYYGVALLNPFFSFLYDILFTIFDYTRNGLFFVPLFLVLGYMVKCGKNKPISSFCYSCIFFLFMTIEAFLLHHFLIQRHDSMYIFLPFVLYFLFSFLIQNTNFSNKKFRKMATIIYIFHPFFIVFIRFVSKFLHLEGFLVQNHFIFYLVVSFVTFLFAYFLESIKLGKGVDEG